MADLLGDCRQFLVILAASGADLAEIELGLVDLGCDHGDVDQQEDLLQYWLLLTEGRTAFEG